jgi:hypothetical protein
LVFPTSQLYLKRLDAAGGLAGSRGVEDPVCEDAQRADSAVEALEAALPSGRPQTMQWSDKLLEDNGGTILAVAGGDYCVLAADTRLSRDCLIRTRNVSRIMEVRGCCLLSRALCVFP